jgi:peptidoglycan/xylan/chitin deacetylase (PgdA/CDA1 family)
VGDPKALLLTLVALGCAGRPKPIADKTQQPIEVAVTVDDLPRHDSGRPPPEIAKTLLDAFARHRIRQVYGFVNGKKLQDHPEDRAVLEAWLAAGHPLGNHTWAHGDIAKIPLDEYLAGIDRNEPLLSELQPSGRKVFRYPFLREGVTVETRRAVRAHLATRGYRIAEVTIDPFDWAYNPAYIRCTDISRADDAAALRASLLSEARAKLRWANAEARVIVGRPIRHVLLLHLGTIDADTIEDMLTDYERLGVRWISFDEAMTDPVYAGDPDVADEGMFLFQLFDAKGVTPPPPPLPPSALLKVICRPS